MELATAGPPESLVATLWKSGASGNPTNPLTLLELGREAIQLEEPYLDLRWMTSGPGKRICLDAGRCSF